MSAENNFAIFFIFLQKYLEYEDSREQHQQDLQSVIDQLEHSRRQSETKAKQLQDQGNYIRTCFLIVPKFWIFKNQIFEKTILG